MVHFGCIGFKFEVAVVFATDLYIAEGSRDCLAFTRDIALNLGCGRPGSGRVTPPALRPQPSIERPARLAVSGLALLQASPNNRF